MIIREYEKIFAKDCPAFNELSRFADASDFLSIGWKYVQAKNYVGVIRLPSGFQIEILPKLNASTEKLRGLVINMIRTLKDFSGKKFLNADLDTARLDFWAIFIRIYLDMVRDLVKRGLKSTYVTREDNLNVFKGKLLINENLRHNVAHMERFYVAYDEYSLDRPEHRLIKAALWKLRREKLARQLLESFDTVTTSTNYAKDFAAVSIDRTNREYRAVMNWTEIFLRSESFTLFAGKSEAIALLFDMNKLFEAYVAEHIKKHFSEQFTVKIQAQEKYLFAEPRRFGLRPDIVLEKGNELIILDTKWKSAPTEADMYQMLAYARRHCTKKIILLCSSDAEEKFYRAEDLEVKIIAVDLFDMKKLLAKVTGS